jgi:hypothetical protein
MGGTPTVGGSAGGNPFYELFDPREPYTHPLPFFEVDPEFVKQSRRVSAIIIIIIIVRLASGLQVWLSNSGTHNCNVERVTGINRQRGWACVDRCIVLGCKCDSGRGTF